MKNKAAAENPEQLRGAPKDMIFVTVDKNEKFIAFLIPEAIQDAFRHVLFPSKIGYGNGHEAFIYEHEKT